MAKKITLAVLRTLLVVLLAVTVCGAVLLTGIRRTVFRAELYTALPDNDGFVEGMTEYILKDLEAECLFYDIPFETMRTAVTAEWVHALSREYTAAVYDGMCNGKDSHEFEVDPAVYRAVLDTYFATLPEGEHLPDANATETLAADFADSTSAVLSGAMGGIVVTYGHRFVYGDTAPVRRLAMYNGWAIAIAALLTVLSVLPFGSEWRRRLYATAGSLFLGASFAAVPLWLFARHGLSERLAIADSPLKLYVDGIVSRVTSDLTAFSLWVWLGAAVVLLASVVLLALKKEKQE